MKCGFVWQGCGTDVANTSSLLTSRYFTFLKQSPQQANPDENNGQNPLWCRKVGSFQRPRFGLEYSTVSPFVLAFQLSSSSTHVHVNPRPTVSEKWLSVYWLESPIWVNLCSIISIITTEEWGKRKTTRNKGFSMISNLFIYFWTFLDQDYQYTGSRDPGMF